ncbi:MAG: carbohydrate ABC transporter permease [Alphaproteobacteria bacterium]|nr:carbohydrate ABC transporter permease [Alphaproteobacteria bacterium]
MSHESRAAAVRFALYALLVLCTALTLFPYAWMMSSSFKPNVEIFQARIELIPANPILGNYVEAIEKHPVGRAILNSIVMAGVETLAVVVTSVFTAYPFARLRFPGREALFLLILGTMMIPSQVTMIPAFMLIKWLGWIDTYQGLIVPRIMTPLGIFLMRQFLQTLPRELEEAARIDGCSRLQTLTRVLVPLCGPAVATLAIFTFTASWNEFFWPLIVVQSTEMWTIQLLIAAMKQAEVVDWGVVMAVVTMSVVPTVTIYVLLQRYFVKGIAMSGLKG